MQAQVLAEVIVKLIGKTNPIGETQTDNERFENLKIMCEVVNIMVKEIDDVASNRTHFEFSRKRAGVHAYNFLTKNLGIPD
jgi:predicted nucleic acid-binding protein